MHRLALIALVASFSHVQAETTACSEVQAACSALHTRYPEKLVWDPIGPNGNDTAANAKIYNATIYDYWNAENSDSRPACGFFPSNAKEVQFAVQILNAKPSVRFAVKGGGHNPNAGFSSIDKGVLIAFRPNSQYATPAPDGKSIEVGAGCKWEDVYSALGPLGKATVGGRLGDVGVMGLTLGGGLSYLSAQYGFACDNVLNYECVLANGTVVNASPTSHPDLYFALGGGGNQFAIVTKMTLKTYDVGVKGQIWGGIRIYGREQHTAVNAAIAKFTAESADPKAALIPTVLYIKAGGLPVPAFFIFFFYDGLTPATDVFKDFDAIPHLSDDVKTRSYVDLTNLQDGGDMKGLRFLIRENTFPTMPVANMTAFLEDHYNLAINVTTPEFIGGLPSLSLFNYGFQPVPRTMVEASKKARGGSTNALSMEPESGDRVWVEYDISWANSQCDEKCPEYLKKIVDQFHDLHASKYAGIYPTHYEKGDLGEISYNPIFMNDAMKDQNVLQSYGAKTYNKLKSIHQAYDPSGFLSKRQGGFR